jgi:hypothetical protein
MVASRVVSVAFYTTWRGWEASLGFKGFNPSGRGQRTQESLLNEYPYPDNHETKFFFKVLLSTAVDMRAYPIVH